METGSDEKLWNYYQRVNPIYFATASRDKILTISKLIKRYTRREDYLCEIGLGHGLMLQQLSQCRNIIGIDLCEETIQYMKSKSAFKDIKLIHGDICKLSLVCPNVDAVITIDVIEHLTSEQLAKACQEVYKVLKKGGKWFINIPWNEDLKFSEIFCPHCNKTFHRVGHKQSFDESRLRAILNEAGFSVSFIKKFYYANFMLPTPLLWLYRIVARIYLRNYASMFTMALKC